MAWMNPDGLYLKFGTEKATVQDTGEYKTYGALRTIETYIDLSDLTTAVAILSDNTFFPAGMFVESVEVVTDVASTSTAATFNVGLAATSRSSEVDYDGFLADFAPTNVDSTGERVYVTAGSSGAGAFLGARPSQTGYLCSNRDSTAAHATGQVTVRINYRP